MRDSPDNIVRGQLKVMNEQPDESAGKEKCFQRKKNILEKEGINRSNHALCHLDSIYLIPLPLVKGMCSVWKWAEDWQAQGLGNTIYSLNYDLKSSVGSMNTKRQMKPISNCVLERKEEFMEMPQAYNCIQHSDKPDH